MSGALAATVGAERRSFVTTLRRCGPAAPTLAGAWTSRDVARHVSAQDRLFGLPAAVARRVVVATGWRLNKPALAEERVARVLSGWPRSWEWSLARLSRPPPAALVRGTVAHVTLWEHWVHHEDVRRPAGLDREEHPDLFPVLPWLLRYLHPSFRDVHLRIVSDEHPQVEVGAGEVVSVSGALPEVVLWLSGRGGSARVEVDGARDVVARLEAGLAV